jgi:hypothetical protein
VGVAAPAFAASASFGTGTFSTQSCRCGGNMATFSYRLNILFPNTTGASYTVNPVSITSTDGAIVLFPAGQTATVANGGQTVLFRFRRASNTASIQVTFTYTTTQGTTTSANQQLSGTFDFPTCGTGICP